MQQQIQSIEVIQQKWEEALVGQPWHIQKSVGMSTTTIVGVVAKLQENTVQQANAMKWINEMGRSLSGAAMALPKIGRHGDNDHRRSGGQTTRKDGPTSECDEMDQRKRIANRTKKFGGSRIIVVVVVTIQY